MARIKTLLFTVLPSAFLILMIVATWQACFAPWTFAHDEGLTGLTAANVLQGQLPHVDFVDPYSGGSAFLHSLMYRMFGEGVVSSRYALFSATMGLALALIALARSIVSTPAAIFVTAMALAWGPVAYMTALPSWYNLAAMAMGAALLHFGVRRGSYLALVAAGLVGGLSILAKTTGAYFCIAAVLYLLLDASYRSGRTALAALGAVLATVFVCLVTLKGISVSVVFYFLLPVFAAATLVAWPKVKPKKDAEAWAPGVLRVGAFVAGVALVAIPWIGTYAWHHQLDALWRGLVVLPSLRLDFAARPLPPISTCLGAVVAIALYVARSTLPQSTRRYADFALVAALLVLLVFSRNVDIYQWTWHTIRWLLPLSAITYFAIRLIQTHQGKSVERSTTDLLWTMIVFGSLIQFPFSFALYFLYIAPLFILALFLTTYSADSSPTVLSWAVVGFLGFFCIHTIHGSSTAALASATIARPTAKMLELPRAGIPVPEYDQAVYSRIAELVKLHGASGPILAYPDCPEVAFLAGANSALRSAYRFMAPDEVNEERLADILANPRIRIAVLNTKPEFSQAISNGEYAVIAEQLQNVEDVGHFRVLWRSDNPQP